MSFLFIQNNVRLLLILINERQIYFAWFLGCSLFSIGITFVEDLEYNLFQYKLNAESLWYS